MEENQNQEIEQLYTAEEVAELGKVSRETVWRWMRQGKLRWVWFGTEKRIPASAVRAIVRSSDTGGTLIENNTVPAFA